MRLLYVITSLGRGGAETQAYNLARAMAKREQVAVAYLKGGVYAELLEQEGIKTIRLEARILASSRKLKETIDRLQPDIVHSFLPQANIAAKLAKKKSRHECQLITSYRGSMRIKNKKEYVAHLIERLLDDGKSIITTNSQTTKRLLSKRFCIKKESIVVIDNGLDLKPAKQAKLAGKAILTTGQFRYYKDYRTNIETCEELLKLRDDIHFYYAGDGPDRKRYENLVQKKGLRQRITFLGNRDDLPSLLMRADVFFLPSLYESQSNALIEAMHYGCPIVTTSIPENKELLINGKEALLAPIKNPKRMAAHIDRLLDDKALKERLVKQAKKKSEGYTIKALEKTHRELYNKILKAQTA